MSLSRREFLKSLSLTWFGVPAAVAALSEPSLPFRQLCAELCGFEPSDLDPHLAAIYYRALIEFEPHHLQRLIETGPGQAPDLQALEYRLIEMWYSGLYSTGSGSRRATWGATLGWEAADFCTPPTYCGPAWWRSS